MFGVNYVELSENVGRARIRNRLARLARYEWLLFLDCDCKITGKKYIKNYVQHLSGEGAYVGGTIYSKTKPKSKSKMLHWVYGQKREARTIEARNKRPAQFFHSNNFLISRNMILEYPFSDELKEYGFEDLALGQKLAKHQVMIQHIDNPVLHSGLKKNQQFMHDQIQAMNNLAYLIRTNQIETIRLVKVYKKLKRMGLFGVLRLFVSRYEQLLTNALFNRPNRLYLLDIIKLYYFDKALNKAKNNVIL